MIYHVTQAQAWQQAQNQGFYTAPSLAIEGFIHTSKAEQVEGVLNRYYVGQDDLVLLHIEPSQLEAELKYEMATNQELFPHIYGVINLEAIVKVEKIR
jgi:uncharacterized protein (DUF952 family)